MGNYEYTKKWRKKFPEKRAEGRKRYYDKSRGGATRSQYAWTSKEMELLETFEGTDTQLAEKIGRSVRAIQVKRAKIKGGY